jgi:hypothetical protein
LASEAVADAHGILFDFHGCSFLRRRASKADVDVAGFLKGLPIRLDARGERRAKGVCPSNQNHGQRSNANRPRAPTFNASSSESSTPRRKNAKKDKAKK